MAGVVKSSWVTGKVLENFQWSKRLLSLRIEADIGEFKAGQFVRLQVPLEIDGVMQPLSKSYSLINPPGEAPLEVFYNIVPNGKLSTALAALKSGDSIEVSQPANGFFVLDEVPITEQLWMVATGTGLGPFLSILQTAQVWDRYRHIILVHSVPVISELAYSELIQSFAQTYPDQFRFISCVTREANPAGLGMRVTTALASGELEQQVGLSFSATQAHFMLCGNHNMLNDMKDLLGQRGLNKHLRHRPGQITTEQYF